MRLLVSDVGRGAVAQLDAWGAESLTWLEPGGPLRPAGVVGLGDGRIVAADPAIHRIGAWDGVEWRFFGEQGGGVGQFDRPTGVSVDPSGRIHVADTGNGRLVRLDDIEGSGWTTYGQRLASSAELSQAGRFAEPTGIAVGTDGRLHIADPQAGRVVSIDDIAGSGWNARSLAGPIAVAAPTGGAVGVALLGGRAVAVIDDAGPPQTTAPGTVATPLAVAALGAEIVCCDGMASRLLRLELNAGGPQAVDEWRLEDLGIRRPTGLAVIEES